jgi:N utilization substance protein A
MKKQPENVTPEVETGKKTAGKAKKTADVSETVAAKPKKSSAKAKSKPEEIKIDPKIELFAALKALANLYQIPLDALCRKIEDGMLAAVKKEYDDCDEFTSKVSPEENVFEVCVLRTVVDDEPIDINEINIEEARVLGFKDCALGDKVPYALPVEKFGRVAALQAKQSLRRDIREFEKDKLIEAYKDKEHQLVSATVHQIDPQNGGASLIIDGSDAFLPRSEQIPGEVIKAGETILVYVVGIFNPEKKPTVKISRTNREFVRKLFEHEVPEIAESIVEIKEVSREAGAMSKVAVISNKAEVDPVGACIGPRSTRINTIVSELCGERVDLIIWNEDPKVFIANSLAPAAVISVDIPEGEEHIATVVVPNNQLSLAIGKKGLNAKLAARLTGYKIDIKAEHPENQPSSAV